VSSKPHGSYVTNIEKGLLFYMSSKVFMYFFFLAERVYVIGGSKKPRLKTKLWLFNSLFMICEYEKKNCGMHC
jgi:hypothetical protein